MEAGGAFGEGGAFGDALVEDARQDGVAGEAVCPGGEEGGDGEEGDLLFLHGGAGDVRGAEVVGRRVKAIVLPGVEETERVVGLGVSLGRDGVCRERLVKVEARFRKPLLLMAERAAAVEGDGGQVVLAIRRGDVELERERHRLFKSSSLSRRLLRLFRNIPRIAQDCTGNIVRLFVEKALHEVDAFDVAARGEGGKGLSLQGCDHSLMTMGQIVKRARWVSVRSDLG